MESFGMKTFFSISMPLLACLIASAPAAEEAGKLVLDESAYWRFYLVPGQDFVSGKLMKEAGTKLISSRTMKRLEKRVKKQNPGRDWSRDDWRDHVTVVFRRIQEAVVGADVQYTRDAGISMPPPKAEWVNSDFDDSGWPRQRKPLLMGAPSGNMEGNSDYGGSTYQVGWRQGFYRTCFRIPDPEAAGELKLSAVYRGGIRVFLNGTEIARGGLPEGDLTDGACGTPYPQGAYGAYKAEISPRKARNRAFIGIGDFFGSFERAPRAKTEGFCRISGGAEINRKGWDRISSARNRILKPLVLPGKLLCKGANVLAIELRASSWHPVALQSQHAWHHLQLLKLELRASDSVPQAMKRPTGMQVWVEDVHKRLVSREFLEPGGKPGSVNIVGVKNGTFSSQLVVGSEKDLAGIKITPSDLALKGAPGTTIPATDVNVQTLKGRSLYDLGRLGTGRGRGGRVEWVPGASLAAWRHASDLKGLKREVFKKRASKIRFFDQVSPGLQTAISARSCQPYFVSFRIPADAVPGVYTGSIQVSAKDQHAVSVPVRIEVLDWLLPDASRFQTRAFLEQSPHGVAKHYKVELWSDAHFKHMEATFKQLGRIGNGWMLIPVIHNTEFANDRDSPVRWIRGKDGKYRFDFTAMDRYIDLVVRHAGRPEVICFSIMHADTKAGSKVRPEVWLEDESGGKKLLQLDSSQPHYREAWSAFALSLFAHMKKRGLSDAVFWGMPWDNLRDRNLMALLKEVTPRVPWFNAGHRQRHRDYCKGWSMIYQTTISPVSQKGWKVPYPFVSNPRANNSVSTAEGVSLPYAYRLWVNRALVSGLNGIGRIGADYWCGYGYPFPMYMPVYMPCRMFLWPGESGAESSVRYEMLIEGVQETEARIYCEQALEAGVLSEGVAGKVRLALDGHNRETLHVPSGWAPHRVMEATNRWQERSRTLFAAAAVAAKSAGLTLQDFRIVADVPARGTRECAIRLRNWTGKPRGYKLASDESWIELPRKDGECRGFTSVPVRLSADKLAPGSTAKGSVNMTDVASGKSTRVSVEVRVSPVATLSAAKLEVFNVTAGGEECRNYILRNLSGTEFSWRFKCELPWVTCKPNSTKIPPGESKTVTVKVVPPSAKAARHDSDFSFAETGGDLLSSHKLTVFSIPGYEAPKKLPNGEPVELQSVSSKLLKSHKSPHLYFGMRTKKPRFGKELGFHHRRFKLAIGDKSYETGVWVAPRQETVYGLNGSGFKAFSVEVGLNQASKTVGIGNPRLLMNFEIWVDGNLRTQSGPMSVSDAPRLLAVDGLENAKELRLLARTHDLRENGRGAYGHWAAPRFYK